MEKHKIENYVFFFRELSEEMKDQILLACVRNDARYYCLLKNSESVDVIRRAKEEMKNLQATNLPIHMKSFVDSYICIRDYVEKRYHDVHPFFRAEFVNYLLRIHDICPMLNYAFDGWYYSPKDFDPRRIIELAELSISYLYRIVPLEDASSDAPCGMGAYGVIEQTSDGAVAKIPMNYAAFLFANEEEWKIFQILKDTELAKNIPSPIAFDESSKKLVREYIPGMTGHELLVRGQMDEVKIASLQKVFSRIRRVQAGYRIFLDIHPANFVWNEENSQWYFFDLGSVPHIGSDYYPDSFDAYYEKVWKERLDRMVRYPIRSVEL